MPSKIDKYNLSRKHDRRCKTTDDDVLAMRKLYHGGVAQSTIGRIFGISQSAVSYAVSSKSRATLARYKKENPAKGRTKEEDTNYHRELRAYKRGVMLRERDENNRSMEKNKNEE